MSDENQKTPATETQRSRLKTLGIAAGVLLAVFLLGYVPSCRSANSAEAQRAQVAQQLSIARLHSQLGMVSFEVNRNNYSKAANYSTDFFNALKMTINDLNDAALKEKLQAISARRDEITAHLAQADPTVKEKIGQLYADFYPLATAP
jgi:hypothetical protein